MGDMSGDEDVPIDDLSASGGDSDGSSLIDASPSSGPSSPVLGAARPAGRASAASSPPVALGAGGSLRESAVAPTGRQAPDSPAAATADGGAPEVDSDVEVVPADGAESPPRAAAAAAADPAAPRRSIGASSVWRETDFQTVSAAHSPDRMEAAPAPPAEVSAAHSAVTDHDHKTPTKAVGGGTVQ